MEFRITRLSDDMESWEPIDRQVYTSLEDAETAFDAADGNGEFPLDVLEIEWFNKETQAWEWYNEA